MIKHLSITGHQPSIDLRDHRKVMRDFKQCYTCKKVFDGYYNLMDHRKTSHPSNKKCRYFPTNCKFGSKCWYFHEDMMEVDTLQSERNIRNSPSEVSPKSVKNHKEVDHIDTVTVTHPSLSKQPAEDFQKVLEIFPPPDQFSKMFQMMTELTKNFEMLGNTFKKILH